MQLIRHLPPTGDRATAVAIGNFDGVHRGHQAVIQAMVDAARPHGLIPSVLTFTPHPRRYFQPDAPNFYIASMREKLINLRAAGIGRVYMPRFNATFAQMPAEDFLHRVLGQQLHAKVVVTGENFTFGHQRRGDVAMMKAWGAAQGVAVTTVAPVMLQGRICSSTAVRAALAQGDMASVTTLMGRPYRLSGYVTHGDGRGRTIGFPTANLVLAPGLLLPARGVYAVRAEVDGVVFDGVANLGVRPTVAVDSRQSFEVHLFDTMQEIYGKRLSVSLVHKIRDEVKFADVNALKEQIARDCATARKLLKESA